jgi:hypothetical protein
VNEVQVVSVALLVEEELAMGAHVKELLPALGENLIEEIPIMALGSFR